MNRILVAGIGNIFLGDDAFGVEVARRLGGEQLADGVTTADFGIRGVHLAYELAEGHYDGVILVDAVRRGGAPGTLYAIEPDPEAFDGEPDGVDAHSLTPAAVLAWVRRVGGRCGRMVIVGCEPASIDESIGLSDPVAASIDGAIQMVREMIEELGMPLASRSFQTAICNQQSKI
jgi:hydrogenase maturation protease